MRRNPHFLHFAVNFTLKVAYIFVFLLSPVEQFCLKAVLWAFFCFSCIFSPNVANLQFFVTCQAFFVILLDILTA